MGTGDRGVFFFGYFLLDKQKKVTAMPGHSRHLKPSARMRTTIYRDPQRQRRQIVAPNPSLRQAGRQRLIEWSAPNCKPAIREHESIV
jgi:hypothetical protein